MGSFLGSLFSSTDICVCFCASTMLIWAFLVPWLVKNLLAIRETWVRHLGWEDPLEKGTATNSSILAWRIPWSRKESDTTV